MLDASNFQDEVTAAKLALQKMVEHQIAQKMDPAKALEALLKHYTDRMLTDNERVWRTGALFIPISLAAFAALTSIRCLQVWQVLVLGVPSTALMFAWIVLAENHRAFQEKSEVWIIAICAAMGLQATERPKSQFYGKYTRITRSGAIRELRWRLFYGVAIAWAIILAGACTSWLVAPRLCLMPM